MKTLLKICVTARKQIGQWLILTAALFQKQEWSGKYNSRKNKEKKKKDGL